ncbi:ABC transporter substrate-binding protein [Mesobaculum littorinae]|uniref:ABC transporter substrate-binding protein n=1 Tax=Mesobaculum littorinae TaxID=2486419 RepID=A0A438AMW1_9RHOB|nr:ABC transporter substrate-binding protein [Mesobaculum littorinae]RVV99937.1 ABC transporter substrate-binding protein [Mesobaculum littorinae]
MPSHPSRTAARPDAHHPNDLPAGTARPPDHAAPLSRRALLTTVAAGGAALAMPGIIGRATAQAGDAIRLGAPFHRTGVGASYGRWYERTAAAAVKVINEEGGINGRPVEMIVEDDGTDPRRGVEVMEKFAAEHRVDAVFGHLFSHVVAATAPRAGELKMPYFLCSETHALAAGAFNRYCFQPSMSDVKSQVRSMAPWIADTLGRKITLIYPDYAFGYDHRDNMTAAIEAQGGEVVASIAIPPAETSFTRYMPRIPFSTEVIYHVMVGPAVLTFVRELGEFLGANRPEIFGFIDSLEAVKLDIPQLAFLDGTYLWEGHPRHAQNDQSAFDVFYRDRVGVDAMGASLSDPQDVSTYAHMFSVWETLFAMKQAMEAADYRGPGQKTEFLEAMEAIGGFDASNRFPQGSKIFNGRTHQAFADQMISQVRDGRLEQVHKVAAADTVYEDETDYTKMSF